MPALFRAVILATFASLGAMATRVANQDSSSSGAAKIPTNWLRVIPNPLLLKHGPRAGSYVAWMRCPHGGCQGGQCNYPYVESNLPYAEPEEVAVQPYDYKDVASGLRFLKIANFMKTNLNTYQFPRVLGVSQDTSAGNVWLLTEGLGSSLVDHAAKNDLRTKSRWLVEALSGVAKMHKEGLVHGNLRPSNIVFTGPPPSVPYYGEYHALITNPGGLTEGSEEALLDVDDLRYTPYEASELPKSEHGEAADVWAMGLVYYEMFFGELPKPIREASDASQLREALKNFNIEDDLNFLSLVTWTNHKEMFPEGIDKQMLAWESQTFLRWTLNKDAAWRYSAEDAQKSAEKIAKIMNNEEIEESYRRRAQIEAECMLKL